MSLAIVNLETLLLNSFLESISTPSHNILFFLSFYKTQRVLDVLFLVALKLIIVGSCQDSKRSAVARQA